MATLFTTNIESIYVFFCISEQKETVRVHLFCGLKRLLKEWGELMFGQHEVQ